MRTLGLFVSFAFLVSLGCESSETTPGADAGADAPSESSSPSPTCCAVMGIRADVARGCIHFDEPAKRLGCAPVAGNDCVMNGATGCIMRRVRDGGPPTEVYLTPTTSFLESLPDYTACDEVLRGQIVGAVSCSP